MEQVDLVFSNWLPPNDPAAFNTVTLLVVKRCCLFTYLQLVTKGKYSSQLLQRTIVILTLSATRTLQMRRYGCRYLRLIFVDTDADMDVKLYLQLCRFVNICFLSTDIDADVEYKFCIHAGLCPPPPLTLRYQSYHPMSILAWDIRMPGIGSLTHT